MEQYTPSPHHAVGIYLNPAFSSSCGFRFDVEVMDGFLTCVQRMVLDPQERAEISKEMEIYRMVGGTFGFDMAVNDRKTKMPGKIKFILLQISMSLLHLFKTLKFQCY